MILGIVTNAGLTASQTASMNEGFKLVPVSFSVSDTQGALDPNRTSESAGVFYSAPISARVVIDSNTIKFVLTIPPNQIPANTFKLVKEICLRILDGNNDEILFAIGQPTDEIKYNAGDEVTLEVEMAIQNLDLTAQFVFQFTQATEINQHNIDPNAHTELMAELKRHGIFIPTGAYPFERRGQHVEENVQFEGTKATFTYGGVVFTALKNGTELNGETITFNGVRLVSDLVAEFNANNYPYEISHNGTGNEVLGASVQTLTGGTYSVTHKDIVYKDVDGIFKRALADGTIKSKVAGIAFIDERCVVTHGLVDINTGFGTSVSIYLSGSSAGQFVNFDTGVSLGLSLGNYIYFTGFGGDVTADISQNFDAVVTNAVGVGQFNTTQDAIAYVPADGRILIDKLDNVKETIDTLGKNLTIVVNGPDKGWKKFEGLSTQFKINFTQVPTQGSWRIEWLGQETTDLAFNATNIDVQNAFNLFSGHNGVTVTGNYTTGFTFVFNDLDLYPLPTFAFAGLNEIQRFNFSNIPDNGTITFDFNGQTTLNFPWDDFASDLKTALEALPNIQNVNVTGSFASGFFEIEFTGGWLQDGLKDQVTMTVSNLSLALGLSSTDVNGTTILPINAVIVQQGKAKASNLFNVTTPIVISTLLLQTGEVIGEDRLMNVNSDKLSIKGMGRVEGFNEGIVLSSTATKFTFEGYFINTPKKILTNSKLAGIDYDIEVPEFAKDINSQLKLSEHPTLFKRTKISGASKGLVNGIILGQEFANRVIKFDGAEIDWATGNIYKADGVTIESTFTPPVITPDQYRWACVNLIPSTLNADNTMNVNVEVVFASADGVSTILAPKPVLGNRPIGLLALKGALGAKEKTVLRTVRDINGSLKGKTFKIFHPLESVAFWFSDPSLDTYNQQYTTGVTGSLADSMNTSNTKIIAYKIVLGSTTTIDHVALHLKKTGAPTGVMSVRVLGDLAGEPDLGNVIMVGSGTVNLTAIPTNFSSYVLFPLSSEQSLVAGTYWVELDASTYTYSGGNYLEFNSMASGAGEFFNRLTSTWLTDLGNIKGHAILIDKVKGYPALALTATREVEITNLVDNDFHSTVATKVNTYVDADTRFVSTVTTNKVEIENTTLGNVTHLDVGDTGFFTQLLVDGTDTDPTGIENVSNDLIQNINSFDNGGYFVTGTNLAPSIITAVGGINSISAQRELHFVKSNGGAVSITANPKIQAGTKIGQEKLLIGASDTDFVILTTGNGVKVNGSKKLKLGQTVLLVWDGTDWVNGDTAEGTGSGSGSFLVDLAYNAGFQDNLSDPSDNLGTIDITADKTDPLIHDGQNGLYRINYDASKLLSGTGVNVTLDIAPSFTVKKGDVVIKDSEVRIIDTVISQVSFTLNMAFTVDPSSSACCVSQGVYTKDLNDMNDGGTGQKFSALFTGDVDEMMVIYTDSLALNDAIQDIGLANVGFSISADNANWTNVHARPDNIGEGEFTAVSPMVVDNKAIALFFSNKTTGSGAVNLLDIIIAFHRQDSSVNIPVKSSAYARPTAGIYQNCTHYVFGGKSRFTFNFTFPIDNDGKPNGASLVSHMDGNRLPIRVVAVTNDAEPYIKIINGSTIELDADYSASGFEFMFEVLQASIDVSNTNSNRIAELESYKTEVSELDRVVEVFRDVTFSNIVNRAKCINQKTDLSTMFGLKRYTFTNIFNIPEEIGPSGQEVHGVFGDRLNAVRFVGQWLSNGKQNNITDGGDYPFIRDGGLGYIEITFYGRGLVILLPDLATSGGNNSTDLRVSIDNGSEGSDVTPSLVPNYINGARRYIPVVVASNLSMDFHTVRVRKNSTGTATEFGIVGYEVIGPNTMQVNAGTYFFKGKQYILNSLSSFSYNSGFESGVLGTKGGRALVYLKPDGTIGKALTPTNASELYFTNADHTNEEIVDELYWASFGAGATRANDWTSVPIGAVANKHFTKSDGCTALYSLSSEMLAVNANQYEANRGISFSATSMDMGFTFKGTGFDIKLMDNNGGATHDTVNKRVHVYIDDVLIGQMQATSLVTDGVRLEKCVSGLKYGTHTVKLVVLTTQTAWSMHFISAVIYAPKKPTIPSSYIELGEYFIVGNFVANTTEGGYKISQGVIRKHWERGFLAVNGTGGSGGWDRYSTVLSCNNSFISTDRLNAYVETVLFGIGFDIRFGSVSGAMTFTLTVNGLALNTTNFPSLAHSIYLSNGTFNPATGVVTMSGASAPTNQGLVITGLPLDTYKFKMNADNAVGWQFVCVDAISPIDFISYGKIVAQNEALLENNNVNDLRKLPKDFKGIKKLYYSRGLVADWSTSATQFVPVDGMQLMVDSDGEWFDLDFDTTMSNTNTGFISFFINNKLVNPVDFQLSGQERVSISESVFLPKGKNLVEVRTYHNSGSSLFASTDRLLSVKPRNQ